MTSQYTDKSSYTGNWSHVHEACTHFHGHQNRTLECIHFPNKTTITYNVTLKRFRAITFAVDKK